MPACQCDEPERRRAAGKRARSNTDRTDTDRESSYLFASARRANLFAGRPALAYAVMAPEAIEERRRLRALLAIAHADLKTSSGMTSVRWPRIMRESTIMSRDPECHRRLLLLAAQHAKHRSSSGCLDWYSRFANRHMAASVCSNRMVHPARKRANENVGIKADHHRSCISSCLNLRKVPPQDTPFPTISIGRCMTFSV
jgi:hypothetical protein